MEENDKQRINDLERRVTQLENQFQILMKRTDIRTITKEVNQELGRQMSRAGF